MCEYFGSIGQSFLQKMSEKFLAKKLTEFKITKCSLDSSNDKANLGPPSYDKVYPEVPQAVPETWQGQAIQLQPQPHSK